MIPLRNESFNYVLIGNRWVQSHVQLQFHLVTLLSENGCSTLSSHQQWGALVFLSVLVTSLRPAADPSERQVNPRSEPVGTVAKGVPTLTSPDRLSWFLGHPETSSPDPYLTQTKGSDGLLLDALTERELWGATLRNTCRKPGATRGELPCVCLEQQEGPGTSPRD